MEHKSFHLCHSIQIHNNPDHFYKDIDNFHRKDKCNHQHIESLIYISVGTYHLLYIYDLKNNPNLIDISSSTLQDHCNHKRCNLVDQFFNECKLTYHKVDFHCSHLDQSIPSSIHHSHGICNQQNSHYHFGKSHDKLYDLDSIDQEDNHFLGCKILNIWSYNKSFPCHIRNLFCKFQEQE